MYYQYFGLSEAPFSIAVNPRYLFMSARHRDALAHLLYGVGAGDGFILLIGEVGTGKTTINRCLLEQLPADTDMAIILNPALNAIELLATACDELGIDYDREQHTLKSLTDKMHGYLLDNYQRGRKTVLLIDEAQRLDFDTLEQVRLLTNLETNSEKLLQIILIGQPELAQMLARPELRQLNQRITARYNLEPLNLEETGAYIAHRLQVAGMSPDREVFPSSVVRGIYRASNGIPRVINKLCDRVLLGAYGRNKSRADRATLALAIREVLGEQGGAASWQWPVVIAGGLAVVCALVMGGASLLLNDPAPVATEPAVAKMSEIAAAPVRQVVVPTRSAQPESVATPVVRNHGMAIQPLEAAQLSPGESMSMLWQLHGRQIRTAEACPREPDAGLVCVEDKAGTWDELTRYDRPLSLSLVTAERFSAEALLLEIDGQDAWLYGRGGPVRVQLADLAPLWSGSFRYLWHLPTGFVRPLSLGDQGAAVAQVAMLFARLDGQSVPLASDAFNRALDQRVRIFQRRHGLADDGVVGARTLVKLNELLGIDITAAVARERLQTNLAQESPQ